MRKTLYGLMVTAVAVAATGRATAQADAKAVIEKAITAHGGKELLDKYPASKSKFKGDMSVMGLDITFEGSAAQGPGQFKLEMVADIAGQKLTVLQLVDGQRVKTKQSLGGMDIPNMADDAQLDELRFSVVGQEIAQLTPLLTKAGKYAIKASADEDVEGKKAAVVVVTVKLDEKGEKTKEVKLYFDKDSSLLVKTARKGLTPGDPEGKEALQESILSEFKKIDGLQVAMKTVNYVDGKKFMTITNSEHVNLEKLDKKDINLDD
jgi:hypothetical protein